MSRPPGPAAVVARPGADLAAVPLEQLRTYRTRLREEEDRVSYWRRLLHARIDLVQAGRVVVGGLGLADLVRVLGETGNGRRRTALMGVHAADDLPPLPELAAVWVVPGEDDVEQVLAKLQGAEEQLAVYRSALLARLDQATAVLVGRYRADPSAALVVLGDAPG